MKIQLKRSNVLDGGAAKEPTAAQMEFGELAVNYNQIDPSIFMKDANGNIRRIAGYDAVGNDPSDIEGYPDLGDGEGETLDDRYLKLGASAGAQVVQSTDPTEFKGTVGIGGTSASPNIELSADGSAEFAGDMLIGGTLPASPNIELKSNGSATFDGSTYRFGTFDSTNVTSADSGADIRLGTLSLKRNDSDGNPIFKGYSTNGTVSSRIYGTGSAEFNGDVEIGAGNIELDANGTITTAGSILSTNGAQKSIINPNGYAEFNRIGDSTYGAVRLNSASKGIGIFDQNNTSNVQLNYDGSAEFAGSTYRFGTFDSTNVTSADSGADIRLGTLSLKRNDSDGNPIFKGYSTSGTVISRIYGTGSAEFNGDVEIGGGNIELNSNGKITAVSSILSTNGTQQSYINPNGFAEFNRIGDGANGAVRLNSASKGIVIADQNNTAKALLNYDGSAEFTSIDVGTLTLNASTLSSSGTLKIQAGGTGAVSFQTKDANGNYTFKTTDGAFNGRLQFNDITGQRTYKYPDQNGTVVVKDNTTGALTIDNLTIGGSTISSTSTLSMESGATAAINFKSSANNNDYRFYNTAQTFYGSLRFNALASNRIFNFPDNGGTVALTSDSAWVTGSTSTAGILTLASDLTSTFNGDVEIGSNVTIKSSNGNITINGNYQAGGNPASGTADGCRIDTTGTVRAAKTTGSNAIWTGYKVGTPQATSRMNADGSATFSGTVTATVVPPSDARFKTNITPAKPQLADIVALGGLLKNYNWNDKAPLNEELRSQRQLGLIAQEVAEVCPSITKTIHRTRTVETKPAVTDDEGAVVTEAVTKEVDESYKGISQDALIMKLLGAVAELSAEVEALKSA